MSNEVVIAAQNVLEQYYEYKKAQQVFYDAYKKEFGETKEFDYYIYGNIQVDYNIKDCHRRLMELVKEQQ